MDMSNQQPVPPSGTHSGGDSWGGPGGHPGLNPGGQQKSWWGRHWKWVVPVGCLLPILGCGCCFTGILFSAVGVAKSSPVYQQSLTLVQADPRVQAALGSPTQPSWLVWGQVNVNYNAGPSGGASGDAEIHYTLTGPNGTGWVTASGQGINGQWTIDYLVVSLSSGTSIDVLVSP